MKKSIIGAIVLALLIGLAAVLFLKDEIKKEQEPTSVADVAEPAEDQAEDQAADQAEAQPGEPVRYPIPMPPDRVERIVQKRQEKMAADGTKEAAKDPLPSLNESDEAMRELLASLFEVKLLAKVGILNHFIQRFVVTVDNIPEMRVPRSHLPTRPPEGRFLAEGDERRAFISTENFRRYEPYVRLLEALDSEKGVAAYIRFYPLFQKAYRELGYPSASFHYRFMEVIDHLLATPDVPEPIALVRPGVLYQFADPTLENLSGGQKTLIRSGNENASRFKAKLREIRQELIDQTRNG